MQIMQTRNKALRCIALLLVAMLLTSCGAGGTGETTTQQSPEEEKAAEEVVGASETTAATMHLMHTEGEVYVSDDGGKNVEPRENLGLYSGYGLETRSVSYAWINLDNVKLTKMDQDSEIAIQKEGKTLEIDVKSGSLFFNVTEPLADDETMNIMTSTMMVGIRGTCGWVESFGDVSRVYLLEGKVECSAGEHIFTIEAGNMIEMTADGEVDIHPFDGGDIPNFVRDELDEELAAAFPVPELSQFRNQWDYVSEDALSAETKELLRQILDAVQSENWDEAESLALSMVDLEDIVDEDIPWLYSEFNGYRIYLFVWDAREDAEMSKGARIATSVRIEIRPESGQGYYIDCASLIDDYEQPYTETGFAVGQCENYNWTGSFERNAYNTGEPLLDVSNLEPWND